ncbi:hypothetical protein CK203_116446 [Vitis vinifera]|uniref:Reverse transcriptase RNase H-like domain-containing protein n=1 Tax=Vitis vinifera TaxID=29760 RepID=A0A438DQN7_VITVI|nr:hypothetical protein CK203_116446 [Vitis vinifera]
METLEDYDFALHYHPRKANVVADGLSRKSYGQLSSLWLREFEMHAIIEDFELCVGWEGHGPCLYSISMLIGQSILSTWEYQNVSRLKEIVLVAWDEERHYSRELGKTTYLWQRFAYNNSYQSSIGMALMKHSMEDLIVALVLDGVGFGNKVIPSVKVWWQHHGIEEATWELEEEKR